MLILIVFFRYFTYKFKTFGGFRGFGVWMSGFGFCSGISYRGRVRVGELKVEVVPLGFRGFGSLNTSLIRTTSELHSLKKTFKLNLWYPYKSTPLHIFQSIEGGLGAGSSVLWYILNEKLCNDVVIYLPLALWFFIKY